MKRILLCLAALCCTVCTACGGNDSTVSQPESPETVTAEETTTTSPATTAAPPETTAGAPETTTSAELTTTAAAPEMTSSAPDVTEVTEAPETTDPAAGMHGERFDDSHVIAPGLWYASRMSVGDTPERFDTYYEIHADGTGVMVHQENGLRETFRYTFKDDVLGFIPDSGAAMYTADVEFLAADFLTVSYKFQYGGSAEDWNYQGDRSLSWFKFYSNSQLILAAQNYYNAHEATEDTVCGYAEALIDDSGTIELLLYTLSDKKSPLQTYYIDRYTAKGYDWDYEPVDLSTS